MGEVVVVGAGVGGLAAAIRLAVRGHEVTVVERLGRVGGKLDEREADGFRWETGPSLLTLRHVFDDLAELSGRRLDDLVDLVRLDPICRYRFADGSGFDHRAGLNDAVAEVEALSPGTGDEWRDFMAHAHDVWEVSERTFFAGPMRSPLRMLRRMRSPRDLLTIDSLPALHDRAARSFDDPRLIQYVDRYATYSGSSPFRAPATLACIAHLEQSLGAWYVRGGLCRLADALGTIAVDVGVELRLSTEVDSVLATDGRARGVRLNGGETLSAGAIVANADARHLYRDLIDHGPARRRAEAAPPSSSGFVLLLGVDGSTPGLAHHNVAFSADYAAEFRSLFEHGVPAEDPTVYVATSSVTDPSQAPDGHENWFVLVNAPSFDDPTDRRDYAGYGDHVLEVMARRGWDLSGRVVHREEITPQDIADRYRTPGGSIYGTSSNGRRAAFLRPGNASPVGGLFLCGGSSHPGGGLPLVAISGGIAADLAHTDLTDLTP